MGRNGRIVARILSGMRAAAPWESCFQAQEDLAENEAMDELRGRKAVTITPIVPGGLYACGGTYWVNGEEQFAFVRGGGRVYVTDSDNAMDLFRFTKHHSHLYEVGLRGAISQRARLVYRSGEAHTVGSPERLDLTPDLKAQLNKGLANFWSIRPAATAHIAMEFPSQEALDKYLKEHPDADRSNHRVVKDKKDETPDEVEERLKKKMGPAYKPQDQRIKEEKEKWDAYTQAWNKAGKPKDFPSIHEWTKRRKSMTTTDQRVASELLAVARDLAAMDFPSQKALDKYLKEHPDADRGKHKVVKQTDRDYDYTLEKDNDVFQQDMSASRVAAGLLSLARALME